MLFNMLFIFNEFYLAHIKGIHRLIKISLYFDFNSHNDAINAQKIIIIDCFTNYGMEDSIERHVDTTSDNMSLTDFAIALPFVL